jgi:hypothetical protein
MGNWGYAVYESTFMRRFESHEMNKILNERIQCWRTGASVSTNYRLAKQNI